jgi:hypothetical protein
MGSLMTILLYLQGLDGEAVVLSGNLEGDDPCAYPSLPVQLLSYQISFPESPYQRAKQMES